MGRFFCAAGDGDGVGGDEGEAGCGLAEMVVKGEGGGFFDADLSGADVAVGESGGGDFCGALVFLPDADFDGEFQAFAKAAFFEGGDY